MALLQVLALRYRRSSNRTLLKPLRQISDPSRRSTILLHHSMLMIHVSRQTITNTTSIADRAMPHQLP